MQRNTSTTWVLAMAHKQLQMSSSGAWQIFYVNAANDAVIFPRMPAQLSLFLLSLASVSSPALPSPLPLCQPACSALSLPSTRSFAAACREERCVYRLQQAEAGRRLCESGIECVRERESGRERETPTHAAGHSSHSSSSSARRKFAKWHLDYCTKRPSVSHCPAVRLDVAYNRPAMAVP